MSTNSYQGYRSQAQGEAVGQAPVSRPVSSATTTARTTKDVPTNPLRLAVAKKS